MFRIIGKIPKNITIACSGGVDSMVVTNFLLNSRRKIKLAFFNHDTQNSKKAQSFVENFAQNRKLDLTIGRVSGNKGRRSLEEFWRDERYHFFDRLDSDFIITCHHLDDCVETWVMSAMHGKPKLIPYQRENIFRPFLMTSKSEILRYANKKNIEYSEDLSNKDTTFTRNYVRHTMMPHILRVNPGIRTTMRKKMLELYFKK